MKIIVDAFGGDNAPLEIIKGAVEAKNEFGFELILVGKKSTIEKVAAENGISLKDVVISDAPDVISMEDEAGSILKAKSESSMAVGLKLLAAGEGDAFVTAGNSGAIVVGATFLIKRIKGIKRPAFAPILPNTKGCFMLMDSGANVDCRPEMLQSFGIMASIYMEKVMGIKSPRVALANVGVEDHKGGELQQAAYKLLKSSPINFVGNVEGRDIPYDSCDVLVADGFSGNLIVKTYEGVAMALMDKIKGVFTKNVKTKLAAAMVLKEMKEMKKEFDYNEYGGAPIMGVSKPVFKAHGSANAKTIKNAIRLTMQYVSSNVIEEITKSLPNSIDINI
ncbi:MAG: phosphate acyltransferase PlsX [Bacillota bacterium]|nr:phosphate acyltransferase PlsX [Bacillota bacterium]